MKEKTPWTDWEDILAEEKRLLKALDAMLVRKKEARLAILSALAGNLNRQMSPRESQVFDLLRAQRGIQNKEIAERLNISCRTVKMHISNLLQKFGVESRVLLTYKHPLEEDTYESSNSDPDSNERAANIGAGSTTQ